MAREQREQKHSGSCLLASVVVVAAAAGDGELVCRRDGGTGWEREKTGELRVDRGMDRNEVALAWRGPLPARKVIG